jgi:hypothetical protein
MEGSIQSLFCKPRQAPGYERFDQLRVIGQSIWRKTLAEAAAMS